MAFKSSYLVAGVFFLISSVAYGQMSFGDADLDKYRTEKKPAPEKANSYTYSDPTGRFEVNNLQFSYIESRRLKCVTGSIRNVSQRKFRSVTIEIQLFDQDLNLVDYTLDTINGIAPGQVWTFEAPVIKEKVVTKAQIKTINAY